MALIAGTCLPPTTRCASPQHPPALCQLISRRADALPSTGSVHLAGQGRPGYNRWKRITGAQSTCCGHRRRIARCGGCYGPCWSGAAVSEWVICGRPTARTLNWLITAFGECCRNKSVCNYGTCQICDWGRWAPGWLPAECSRQSNQSVTRALMPVFVHRELT